MPPKSSFAAWPWNRCMRTTARKSVLPRITSIPKTSPSPSCSSLDSPLIPPLSSTSTATATSSDTASAPPSSEFSHNDGGLLSSPANGRTLQAGNSSPGESSAHMTMISGAGPREKALILESPDNFNVGDNAQERTVENSSSLNAEVGIRPTNLVPVDGLEVKALAEDETLVGPRKLAADVDVAGTVLEAGKKKVVKRVKVVKKVVKRVVKRVPKGSLESLETERVGNVGTVDENAKNLEHKLNVSEAVEIEKVDPGAIVSLKNEKFEPNDTAPLGVENEGSKEIQVDSTGGGNISPFVEAVSPMGISSGVPIVDSKDGKEGEGIENQIEHDKGGADSVEDQKAIPMEEGATEVEEVAEELVENSGAGLSGELALSGEMEAMERRRRRQKEIFLGGLDKDSKEEDIRKVFEQAGEVTEVRLLMNSETGRNKGFAFVRFASAADAKKALARYSKVEICGKQCGAKPVEGNDTLFLGNINKKWKNDDVIRLLKDAGIEKIDKVIVKADPNNFELNRGFAFLELESSKDAQTAFNKLQKNDMFNKQMKIKVAWAQPLVEPDEKEMLKVKSVYAEYLPMFWDEEKVKIFFKRFGEIESVTLAKNLPSSRRKDFAFVNYKNREAALACIKAFCHDQVDEDGSKINAKVTLAIPHKRSKQMKHISISTAKEFPKNRPKTSQSICKFLEPRNEGIPTSRSDVVISNRANSVTDELIHILRQQRASGRPIQAGSSGLNYHHSSSGSKRPFHELGSSDPRGFPRTRFETSQPKNSSSFSDHIGQVPLPYSQSRNSGYRIESLNGIPDYPHFQIREQPPFFGHGHVYRR